MPKNKIHKYSTLELHRYRICNHALICDDNKTCPHAKPHTLFDSSIYDTTEDVGRSELGTEFYDVKSFFNAANLEIYDCRKREVCERSSATTPRYKVRCILAGKS